jgi:hypothetical protein
MSMLTFYLDRAGESLSVKQKAAPARVNGSGAKPSDASRCSRCATGTIPTHTS